MKKIQLSTISTLAPEHMDKEQIIEETQRYIKKIAKLQEAMMAEQKHALLIVLQSTDASGKDGVVKHVFSGVNPAGTNVTSFKVPTSEEYSHDFLWRIHKVVPGKGKIQIFNRSHYEDVLVPTVHKLFSEAQIKKRYKHINSFEEILKDSGTTILKFYLHISQEVQQDRFKKRMHDPRKLWKFKKKDVNESKHWDEYMKVYHNIFEKCPGWIIIPADNKYYRNYLIAKVVHQTLKNFKSKFPNKITD